MSDELVENIRKENYLLEIFEITKDSNYVIKARDIVAFVKDIYRHIEPSHFDGQLIVFYDFSANINFKTDLREEFYDKGILNNNYNNIAFQIRGSNELPYYWSDINGANISNLLSTNNNFIAYVFKDKKEYFIVNSNKIDIPNHYSCPSIFALQYHYLNESLLYSENSGKLIS